MITLTCDICGKTTVINALGGYSSNSIISQVLPSTWKSVSLAQHNFEVCSEECRAKWQARIDAHNKTIIREIMNDRRKVERGQLITSVEPEEITGEEEELIGDAIKRMKVENDRKEEISYDVEEVDNKRETE